MSAEHCWAIVSFKFLYVPCFCWFQNGRIHVSHTSLDNPKVKAYIKPRYLTDCSKQWLWKMQRCFDEKDQQVKFSINAFVGNNFSIVHLIEMNMFEKSSNEFMMQSENWNSILLVWQQMGLKGFSHSATGV